MASAIIPRAFATLRSVTTRSIANNVPSRCASTSVLYGISALSDRHETQYFSKLSRLPLMEHSPTLKLIHTSEVQRSDSSILSSISKTGQYHQKERGNVKRGQDNSRAQTSNQGDRPAYTEVREENLSSLQNPRLPHRSIEHYESKIARLEQQLLHSQEFVSLLQQENKKQKECHLAERLAAHNDHRRRRVDRLFNFFVYMMGLCAVGAYVVGQVQARAIQELQSSIEDLFEKMTPILEQARRSVESTVSGNNNLQSGDDLALQKLDGTDASSLLEKPTRSWGSLFWKKHWPME